MKNVKRVFGMVKKVAGSKALGTLQAELARQQNHDQAAGYCSYVEQNIDRFSGVLSDLQSDTIYYIDKVKLKSNSRLSFRERGELRRTKETAEEKLQYLYLARDFFTILSKKANGLSPSDEELVFMQRFLPFFDGTPVIELDDDDSAQSIMDELMDIRDELLSEFIPVKKDPASFRFEEYLNRYTSQIDALIMPDVNSAVDSFLKAMSAKKFAEASEAPTPVPVTGSTSTAADQLLKFKDLLDAGLISREEFDAQKRKLLGQ